MCSVRMQQNYPWSGYRSRIASGYSSYVCTSDDNLRNIVNLEDLSLRLMLVVVCGRDSWGCGFCSSGSLGVLLDG